MKRDLGVWIVVAALGAASLSVLFPLVFPLVPTDWELSKPEALALAMERFALLGDPVERPYVVSELDTEGGLDRLLQLRPGVDEEGFQRLANRTVRYRITVHPPSSDRRWTYRALITTSGEFNALRMNVPEDLVSPEIDEEEARRQADAFLSSVGIELDRYEAPESRRIERETRTDLQLRYRCRTLALGEQTPYGVAVHFAGDVLTGFDSWLDDPMEKELGAQFQATTISTVFRIVVPYLLFPFVAFAFLRRYHAGEIGIRRAMQLFGVVFGAGALKMMMVSRAASETVGLGPISRQLTTIAWGGQFTILWVSAVALLAALSWSVGEARVREREGHKLAAFDAFCQLRFGNATIARSSLRGLAAAVVLVALTLGVAAATGARPINGSMFDLWWHHSAWFGITVLLYQILMGSYTELFGRLFLVPLAVGRLGRVAGGVVVALLSGVLFWPPLFAVPITWDLMFGVLRAGFLVALFLAYDLWTVLLSAVGSAVLLRVLPFLFSGHPSLVTQAVIPLVLLSIPALLSLRYLGSGKEFVYRYDDVPPHVRRIAERERQRVELETARRIQSSILPELPDQLHGIRLAHSYVPATEVGGDFYDVLALEDGRLAVAVGDVAGHGVSSGLVMAAAKSALSVQVTFRPEVEEVFAALNRMVYQTARKRLLTTLCYALVDPSARRLRYACAGHFSPYRVTKEGEVSSLQSISYPLGVRDELVVTVREVELQAGDRVILFSDGIIEARRTDGDEQYGFDRFEAVLTRHKDESPKGLRDAIFTDVRGFTGPVEQDDDQTLLILEIP